MKRVWVFTGKGRCASGTAYVVGETEAAAVARLTRDDASPWFEWSDVRPMEVVTEVEDGE